MKRIVCITGALALLAGCPKSENAASDAAPSAAPSAQAPATQAAPPDLPSASATTSAPKPIVKIPTVNLDGGLVVPEGGLALLADAAMPPIPTPSASGSAQPAPMPPECSAYLAKADACVAKRPPAFQAAARGAIAAQRSAWTTMLGQGQSAAVLAQCNAAAGALAADPACK
jgi:hypothetical protein